MASSSRPGDAERSGTLSVPPMICRRVERGIPVTVKMAAVVAVVLSAIGIGVFYASGLILSALPPTMPSFAQLSSVVRTGARRYIPDPWRRTHLLRDMYHQPKTDEQTGAKRRQRTSVRAVSPRGQGRHELGLPCRSESPVHCQRRLDYINGQMGQNQALDQSRDLVLENGSVVRRGPVTIVVRRVGSTDAGNSGANQTGPHRCGHRGRRYPTWLGEPMRLRCHAVARRCRGDLLRRHSRVALRRFGLVGWPRPCPLAMAIAACPHLRSGHHDGWAVPTIRNGGILVVAHRRHLAYLDFVRLVGRRQLHRRRARLVFLHPPSVD